MWIKRVFLTITALFCAASFGALNARAQGDIAWPEWQEVGGLGDSSHHVYPNIFTAIHFFDPRHGVAATAGSGARIYYIANKFGLWKDAMIPPGFTNVRVIRPIQGKLYAATDADVIISTDSGKSWSYSGLQLTNANDVYADASGNIRILSNPMKVFARLDTLHCIAQGTANIFISSDGGLTWTTSGVPMVDSSSTGAFADRCQNVYLCPNSWGTAWRSTDVGQTWRTVVTGSGAGTEYLYGASTTTYIVSQPGLYRSIDDGLTWKSIITVTAGWDDLGAHLPLCVWGPMGEHLVMPWTFRPFPNRPWIVWTEPWMTTTGGDDMLHSGPSMTDSNGAPLMQDDTFNTPFQVTSTCSAMRIPIPFWADVDGLSEKVSIQTDSLGDFSLVGLTTIDTLRRGRDDTLWLAYNPHHAVSNVVLKFDNHWQCSDWSETRTVHVVSIPTAGIVPPPAFTVNCRPDTEAALLKLDSCQTLVIDSVGIPDALIGRLHLVASTPDTARRGFRDSLFFSFDSSGNVGNISDSVTIFGHYIGLDSTLNDYYYFPHAWGQDTNFGFFYRRIPIRMSAGPRISLLSLDSAFSFDTLYPCQRIDTTITLYNAGCDSLFVYGDTISGTNGTYRIDTTYPLVILGGTSTKVRLTAIPDTTGQPANINALLTFRSNSQSAFPPIPLTASIAYPGQLSLVLSHPDSAKPGQIVTVYVILQDGLANGVARPISALHFDLTHDDDLLSFAGTGLMPTSTSGPTTAQVQHFDVTPIPQAGSTAPRDTIGVLTFKVYLADSSSSALTLSNVTFDKLPGHAADCINSIDDSGAVFYYIASCGDSPMQDLLSSGSFTIESIRPNPAESEIEVRVVGGAEAALSVKMYDALGRAVIPVQDVRSTSLHDPVTLDVSSLAEGIYYLWISSGGFVQTRSVSIQR